MDDKLVRLSDVIETVENQCSYGNMWGNENLTLIDASKTIDEISDIPAVDAVEVVRGEWIEDGCMTVCSECHERKEFPHWICCPACGARMDGEEAHNGE